MNSVSSWKIPLAIATSGLIIAIGLFSSIKDKNRMAEVGVVNQQDNTKQKSDSAAEDMASNKSDTQVIDRNSTITENIGKTLLSNLVAAKSGGQKIDDDFLNTTLQNVLNQADLNTNPDSTKFNPIISKDSSKNAIKTYGNQTAAVIVQFLGVSPDEKVVDTPEKVMAFNAIMYKIVSEVLKKEEVPKNYVEQHAGIIQNASDLSYYYSLMTKTDSDPAAIFLAAPKIKSVSDSFSQNILTLGAKLRQDGIIFNSDEPGLFWMQ